MRMDLVLEPDADGGIAAAARAAADRAGLSFQPGQRTPPRRVVACGPRRGDRARSVVADAGQALRGCAFSPQHARRDARVVEPRDPGQHASRRGAPTTRRRRPTRRPPASPASVAATVCAHVLSLPRSRAPITTPRSIAASRRPETAISRATIAATIHAGATPSAIEHHERRQDEHLVRDRDRAASRTPTSGCGAARASRRPGRWPSRRRTRAVAQ